MKKSKTFLTLLLAASLAMSKLTKRLTAMLLSVMLVIGSASGIVYAADIQENGVSETVDKYTGESSVIDVSKGIYGSWGNHTYAIIRSEVSIFEAIEACQVANGHLLTLSSNEEMEYIRNFRKNNNIDNTQLWCGAIRHQSGSWQWMTGESNYDDYEIYYGIGKAEYKDVNGNSFTSYDDKVFPQYSSWKNYYAYQESVNLDKVYHGFICEWDITLDIIAHYTGSDFGHSFLRLNNGLPHKIMLGNYEIEAGKSIYIGFRGDNDLSKLHNVIGVASDHAGCFLNWESYKPGAYNSYCIDTIPIDERLLSMLFYYLTDCGYYCAVENNCTTFAVKIWNKFASSDKQISERLIETPEHLKKELKKRGSSVYTSLPTFGLGASDVFKVTWTGQLIQFFTDEINVNCRYDEQTDSIYVSWDSIRKKINNQDYNLDGYVVFCKDGEENETYIITDFLYTSCTFNKVKPNEKYTIYVCPKMEYTGPAIYDYEDKPFRHYIYYTLNSRRYDEDAKLMSKYFSYHIEKVDYCHYWYNDNSVKTISTSNN